MHKSMHVCILFYVALSFRLPICFRFRYMCFVFYFLLLFCLFAVGFKQHIEALPIFSYVCLSICFFSRSRLSRISCVSDEYTL